MVNFRPFSSLSPRHNYSIERSLRQTCYSMSGLCETCRRRRRMADRSRWPDRTLARESRLCEWLGLFKKSVRQGHGLRMNRGHRLRTGHEPGRRWRACPVRDRASVDDLARGRQARPQRNAGRPRRLDRRPVAGQRKAQEYGHWSHRRSPVRYSPHRPPNPHASTQSRLVVTAAGRGRYRRVRRTLRPGRATLPRAPG